MPTYAYVRDPRFLTYGWAVKQDGGETHFLDDGAFREYLDMLRDLDVHVVMHNAYFDAFVLWHHYDYSPSLFIDTYSMSRALLPYLPSFSLDSVAKHLGLGTKIEGVLPSLAGKRELTPSEFEQLAAYAKQDADLTYDIYRKLAPAFPNDEFLLVDETVRWGANPILEIDVPRAQAALSAAEKERSALIEASGTTLEVLSSQPKFADYLEEHGVEVPMKENSKGELIPALAKNDLQFRQLYTQYPYITPILKAREAAKSTIDITRTERLIQVGQAGTMPMPLRYYGAHTGRWSGADGLNVQNLRRGSELRKSIVAPEGHVILVGDLSQIELRLNFWFCGQDDLLAVFARGEDIYKASAATHFGVPVDEVTFEQRFFAKTLELGLGYQMGWRKFRDTCALKDIHMSEAEAVHTVQAYRRSHWAVQAMWDRLRDLIPRMYSPDCHIELGPVTFRHEQIRLPNGLFLDYTGLEPTEGGQWVYGLQTPKKLYGGIVLENCIQALARIVMSGAILRARRAGLTVVSTTHDELLVVVPEDEAEAAQAALHEMMVAEVPWAPDLPLEAELGYAREYSK